MTDDKSTPSEPSEAAKGVCAEKIPLRETVAVIIKAGIPLILIISLIHSLLNLGIKALFPVMLMESYEGIDASLANILNILLIVAGPIGLLASHTPFFERLTPTKALSALLALALPMLLVVCFVGSVPAAFAIAAMSIVMVFTGAMSVLFSNIARGFVKYNCVGTLVGTINCMAAIGILISNYVFSRIAETRGWQFTAICWLAITALAFVLALASIPLWSRFKKKSEG
jgi:MFS family permease